MQNRAALYVSSYLLFIGIVVFLCLHATAMLMDTDTAWHMAAGDLIRASGNITPPNSWSFTAPLHPWVNVSWLWDVIISYLRAHLGWYGPIVLNSCTIALTITLLYQACLLRSGSGIAAFFSVMLLLLSTVLHLRSLWASNALLALLFLIALRVRHQGLSIRWWYVMPAIMPLWVNLHGGFIMAFGVLGVFGFEALVRRDWHTIKHLTLVSLLSITATACSPYSFKEIYSFVFSFTGHFSLDFINEFKPTVITWDFFIIQLYVPIFIYFAVRYRLIASLTENILAFSLFIMSWSCIRYWNFFYLFSAPMLAQYMALGLGGTSQHKGLPQFKNLALNLYHILFIRHAKAAYITTSITWIASLIFLFTPTAANLFSLKDFRPYGVYSPAITFVQQHYPDQRFINDYGLGATILFLSQGNIPVFLDGRGITAYPDQVIKDYYHIWAADKGWETIIDDYGINGAIVYTAFAQHNLGRLFANNSRWKEVFHDESITIYIRQSSAVTP